MHHVSLQARCTRCLCLKWNGNCQSSRVQDCAKSRCAISHFLSALVLLPGLPSIAHSPWLPSHGTTLPCCGRVFHSLDESLFNVRVLHLPAHLGHDCGRFIMPLSSTLTSLSSGLSDHHINFLSQSSSNTYIVALDTSPFATVAYGMSSN